MKNLFRFLLIFITSYTVAAQAMETPPDVLAKQTTDEVLAIIKTDKDVQAGNRQKILQLVETKVLPYFDFNHMARLALGKYWGGANAKQQDDLITEFRTLLVHTYASSLSLYRDQIIEVKPLEIKSEENDVLVRSIIRRLGKTPVQLGYNMEKTLEGWKVYDVNIDNVSLVTTYRSTFANEINRNGIDGLIKVLAEKNYSNSKR